MTDPDTPGPDRQTDSKTDPPAGAGPADPRDALFDTGHVMSDIGRRTGNAAILLLVMSGLRILQQILAVMVIARLINPTEYGIFALAMPGVFLAMALSNFGLPQAVIQHPHMTHRLATALFWLNLAFGLLATVVVAALAWPAAAFFDEPQVGPVFLVVSLGVLFSAVSGQYIAIMRRTLRIREVELISFGAEFCALLAAIAGAALGLSYWALVLQNLLTPFIILCVLMRVTGWRPSAPLTAEFKMARASLQFGGFVAGYVITARIIEYAGTVVSGRLFGETIAGLFSRANNLAMLPQFRVMTPLSSAFVPALSRLSDDPAGFVAMYMRVASRSCLVMMPIAVMICAGADPMTAVLLGQTWLEAAPILAWLGIVTALASVTLPIHFALLGAGRSDALFAATVVRLGVIVTAMVVAGQYGIVAMTAAYMVVEVAISLPVLIFAALRTTPLGFRAILRGGLVDLGIAAVITGALIGLEPLWSGYVGLVELILLGGLTGLAYGLRILADAGLRGDVRRTLFRMLNQVPARFRPQGPPA